MQFKKILIANRGEIALRILRACKEMDIEVVAIHSIEDAQAMHVKLADESVCIGPARSQESYLNIPAILTAAEISGADAIHPGIGFLSENKSFCEMTIAHGMEFIGPLPEHIDVMGDKIAAKHKAQELGLKTIEGSDGNVEDLQTAYSIAQKIQYPIIIKARSGGGGKGMRVVYSSKELEKNYNIAKLEAKASFGDDGVYIEKYLSNPRHIELQILGDKYGNCVCLGERDCSLQRSHQKIFEEAPSTILTNNERKEIFKIAIDAMQKFKYVGLGTLEFLYENGEFYFIEMNTRLQVEHTVTEMITGIDLVKAQIRVAAGEALWFDQEDIKWQGHSIECRINAENPFTCRPSPGTVQDYLAPGGPGIRIDSAMFAGYKIPHYYDSLVSKLIAFAQNRADCMKILERALSEYIITGIDTNIPLHKLLLANSDIQEGNYDIKWLEQFLSKNKNHEI